jgi:hypothetical protein
VKREIIKEYMDLQGFTEDTLSLYMNKDRFARSEAVTELGEPVRSGVGSACDPIIAVVPGMKSKRLRRLVIKDVLPKPDSERVATLLPERTDFESGALHFVRRNDALLQLLKVHLEQYRRKVNNGAGLDIKYPLIDSAAGLGKTSFARAYLALVEKLVSGGLAEAQSSQLYGLAALWSELKAARTLIVTLEKGSLFCDSRNMRSSLIDQMRKAVRINLGIDLDEYSDFWNLVREIPKPVVIVFDNIGAAFEGSGTDDEKLKQITEFAVSFGMDLSQEEGVYYVMCGRAPFMSELKNFNDHGRPGIIKRINLSPLTVDDIQEMLDKTFAGNEPFSKRLLAVYPDKPLRQIASELHQLTGGIPGALRTALEREKALDPEEHSSV